MLRPNGRIVISDGKHGIEDPSVEQHHGTISFHIDAEGIPYYLVRDGKRNAPSQSGVSYLSAHLTFEPIEGIERLSPGTVVQFGTTRFELPTNLRDIYPYLALRAPEVRMGETYSLHTNLDGTLRGETLHGEFAAHTDVGRGRKVNEDGFFKMDLGDGRTVLGVVDGMGGHGGGDVACDVIARSVQYSVNAGAPLPEAFEYSQSALQYEYEERLKLVRLGMESPSSSMGACVAGVEIGRGHMRFAHAGDCAGLLIRVDEGGRATIMHETKDHTAVQDLLDQGKITKEEAFMHEERNVVTRCISLENGAKSPLEIETSELLTIAAGDWVVLLSDGVTDNLRTEEIVRIIEASSSPYDALERIYACTESMMKSAGGKKDNLSVLVYRHYF